MGLVMKQPYVFISVLLLSLLSCGCVSLTDIASTSQPKQFLLNLQSPVEQTCSSNKGPSIGVNPTQVLPQFDQTSFVYRLADQQYTTDYYHQFFVAPGVQLNQLTQNSLQDACWQVIKPGINYIQRPKYQLSSQLVAFYANYSQHHKPKAVVKIHYYLVNDKQQHVEFDKIYQQSIPVKRASSKGLLHAWNRANRQIMLSLISDIQTYQS